jgi:hypothetical protein
VASPAFLLSLTHLFGGQSACTVISSPSLTEGPYFVDEDLNRRDIRFDSDGSMQAGLPLSLAINVSQLVDCNPCRSPERTWTYGTATQQVFTPT